MHLCRVYCKRYLRGTMSDCCLVAIKFFFLTAVVKIYHVHYKKNPVLSHAIYSSVAYFSTGLLVIFTTGSKILRLSVRFSNCVDGLVGCVLLMMMRSCEAAANKKLHPQHPQE